LGRTLLSGVIQASQQLIALRDPLGTPGLIRVSQLTGGCR
jgi:hypothetical protein